MVYGIHAPSVFFLSKFIVFILSSPPINDKKYLGNLNLIEPWQQPLFATCPVVITPLDSLILFDVVGDSGSLLEDLLELK